MGYRAYRAPLLVSDIEEALELLTNTELDHRIFSQLSFLRELNRTRAIREYDTREIHRFSRRELDEIYETIGGVESLKTFIKSFDSMEIRRHFVDFSIEMNFLPWEDAMNLIYAISTEVIYISSDKIVIIYTNNSQFTFEHGNAQKIQRRQWHIDPEHPNAHPWPTWDYIDSKANANLTYSGYTLLPNQSFEKIINLAEIYGEIEPGDFRVLKDFFVQGSGTRETIFTPYFWVE